MSESKQGAPSDLTPLTPISRRKTFDTGTAQVSAPTGAKRRLSRIIHEKVSLPKGTYVFKSLASADEIRILRILKGSRGQKIECALLPNALPTSHNVHPNTTVATPKYDALSYWWGDDEARNEITINSYEPHRTASNRHSLYDFERHSFFIRPNLEAALRQIQSEERDVDIWVDAICINQEDKKEKTAQVSRMHEIYSRAEKVCIWLGAGVPETKETFDFLKEILNLQNLDRLIASGETPEKWKLVVRLMENRWFSRRWVIQELALARDATVRWGAEKMDWSSFADAIALFMTKHDEIKQILSRKPVYPNTSGPFGDARALGANTLVNATNNLFRKSEDGKIQQRLLTLETLVSCQFLAFEASDPRDIIYAVLSIAKDTSTDVSNLTARTSWMVSSQRKWTGVFRMLSTAILHHCSQAILHLFVPVPDPPRTPPLHDARVAPDYDKSLIDVLADFMDYCIEHSHSLDILCRHWAPPPRRKTQHELLIDGGASKEVERMPSWIPSIKGNAFGGPEDAIRGRLNGDSFVGSLERQNQQRYNASAGLRPCVRFGRYWGFENQMDSFIQKTPAKQLPTQCATQATAQRPWPHSIKYDGTLYIRGFRLDKITKLSGRVSQGMIQMDALEMGGWPPDCIDPKVPDLLWRTLVADRGPDGINAPAWYHRACRECLIHVDQNGDLNTNKVKGVEGTPTTIVSFLDRVQRVTWNRRFFQSRSDGDVKKGRSPRFGLVPPKAELGDIICIIFGCSVPVLLREFHTYGDSYFEFVGECYVHGYMDGEAVPKVRPVHPYDKAQEFKVR